MASGYGSFRRLARKRLFTSGFFATFQSFCSKRWLMPKISAISQKITYSLYFNLILKRAGINVYAPRYERFFECKLRLRDAPIGGSSISFYANQLLSMTYLRDHKESPYVCLAKIYPSFQLYQTFYFMFCNLFKNSFYSNDHTKHIQLPLFQLFTEY